MGYNLEDVLRSKSVLKEGLDFFTANSDEFVKLVQQNIVLAKEFAETFTEEQVKTMFKPGFFSNPKILTNISALMSEFKYTKELRNLLATMPEFKEEHEKSLKLNQYDMIMALEKFGLKHYNVNNYNSVPCAGLYAKWSRTTRTRHENIFYYQTNNPKTVKPVCWGLLPQLHHEDNKLIPADDLSEIYQEAITRHEYVSVIISICKTLIEKLQMNKTPLDVEFSTKPWGVTNDLLWNLIPALEMKFKPEIFSLMSKVIANTSPDIIVKALSLPAQNDSHPDLLHLIIKHLPMSKKAFTKIISALEQIAITQGYARLKQAVDLFNFDILKELQGVKSKESDALAFYRIGEKALDSKGQNVMLEKYPILGPAYQKLIQDEQKKLLAKIEPQIEASAPPPLATTQTLVFSPNNPLVNPQTPPPFVAPPAYNPELIRPNV